MQHKYRETVLFFPSNGQTCHAYCTYCFRWPQFVGDADLRFASPDAGRLVAVPRGPPGRHGRPDHRRRPDDHVDRSGCAATSSRCWPIPTVRTIRIGTKSLAYWPQRFTTDPDADDVLRLFESVVASGSHAGRDGPLHPPARARARARPPGHRPHPDDRRGDLHPGADRRPRQRRERRLGAAVAHGLLATASCRTTCSSPATPVRTSTSRCRSPAPTRSSARRSSRCPGWPAPCAVR